MSKLRALGHISPVATHIMAFLMGASLLLESQTNGVLGPWEGVLISIPQSQGVFDQGYLMKSRSSPPCLLHQNPFYLHRGEGDTPGLLLPKDPSYMDLAAGIVTGKVRVVGHKSGMKLCPSVGRKVVYD